MKIWHRMKKGDLILMLVIGFILILSLLLVAFRSGDKAGDSLIVDITSDDKIVQKIDLSKVTTPQTIKLTSNGFHLIIVAEKNRVRVLEADCPDKKCISFGWLKDPGDYAICMPSKVIVMIEEQGK